MTGESKSTSRPVNSLLEATPEFEVATKMAPLITVEHTTNLEEVIKRRVLDEDWDDVIPRELPDVAWNKKRGELPEVSQEKSKLGLGELYEREYLKKAVGYDVDAAEKETDEEKARNEMKALFANLCSKLDALSNYHFAPRPVADEAEVRAVTTPAIAMEEVLPLHVSDARGVAPEEVYGSKKGRDGILRGDSELDQVSGHDTIQMQSMQ
jgi:U3 small nucleolar RNA-associated protein MPP10